MQFEDARDFSTFGYVAAFSFITVLNLIALFYVMIFAHEIRPERAEYEDVDRSGETRKFAAFKFKFSRQIYSCFARSWASFLRRLERFKAIGSRSTRLASYSSHVYCARRRIVRKFRQVFLQFRGDNQAAV